MFQFLGFSVSSKVGRFPQKKCFGTAKRAILAQKEIWLLVLKPLKQQL